jgi:hypothetical protein
MEAGMTETETKTPQYVHCKECKHEFVAFYVPAPIEEVVRFGKASSNCEKCGAKNSAVLGRYVPADRIYADYRDWLIRGEVGTSSQTILYAITGVHGRYEDFNVPYDPDDFRRCHLLLKAFPELRPKLGKVAERFPEWKALVERWDEVEALLTSEIGDIATGKGDAPKTYALMKELRGGK